MKWHGRETAVRVPKLLMGSTLSDFFKPKALEKCHYILRFEDGQIAHSAHHDELSSDKLTIHLRLAILKQEFNDFLEVLVEFIQALGLGVGARETGHIADKKTCRRTSFNDSGKSSHDYPQRSSVSTLGIGGVRVWGDSVTIVGVFDAITPSAVVVKAGRWIDGRERTTSEAGKLE